MAHSGVLRRVSTNVTRPTQPSRQTWF